MTEIIASHIETYAKYAETAPLMILFFILLFMTIESSFIPFPSEVVMIPAGFLVFRYSLFTGIHSLDLLIVIIAGLAGSMLGAYINYYLFSWVGRPFLHKYGKYFFLKEQALDRAEEIFRKYGDIATFVCRLLPAIRQLISIPAGLSKMNIWRFSFFTALGAGIWNAVLAALGWYLESIVPEEQLISTVTEYSDIIGYAIVGLVVLALGYVIYKGIKKK